MSAVQEPVGTVRPMTSDDLDAVMLIEAACYEFGWTREIFRDCLRVGYRCLLWDEAGQPRGYAVLSIGGGEAHLLNLCTEPALRGRGIARRLLAQVIADARQGGAETLFLEVRPSNPAAVGMYQRAGFNEVGRRRDYYPAARGREDALVMALHL